MQEAGGDRRLSWCAARAQLEVPKTLVVGHLHKLDSGALPDTFVVATMQNKVSDLTSVEN